MIANERPLLELEGVKKSYPIKRKSLTFKKDYIHAVNGITLDIMARETLGVVGESGCGKSTLGRTILQLETLNEGSVKFKSQDVSKVSKAKKMQLKRDMQMIFQDPYASLDPRQKVGRALEEPLLIHTKKTKSERQTKVNQLLKEVDLTEEHAERYPHQFSGGQRQRIGIARALALDPQFIVCDEAVSALDVSVQAQVIQLFQSLQENHDLTYLFISHDLSVIRYISDRILVMYLGNMAELAPANVLYNYPKHPYTKTLLSAIPSFTVNERKERLKLKDTDEKNGPVTGCPFEPRCPMAKDHCKTLIPEWREINPGHFVACHEV
ncbi:ABC transporter ATP-binding protein [Natribacillus halophilus]|uniref:Peptide/nickel transport system ATP-binding protein n=1 Tax=Natribacillus halophilus TaxID=549003 RepID=A0A1G8R928_9BACI|nr:oligopeptide/dipeptide ABC transporter ATP-binding protein [Natribacillus halophilus]SDJ13035.1 peptide/nickel transport system ATP-binding protein [Natribacillus halophilus]